jgi:glucose/mannose transport system substrate-binding protein
VESRTFGPAFRKLPLVSALLFLSACGGELSIGKLEGDESSCALQRSTQVSSVIFSTFWGEGAEGRAVDRLGEETSVLLGRQPFSARAELQGNLLTRLVDGDKKPPDVFQVNGGSDVLQWIDSEPSASQVCPLGGLDAESFRSRYFEAALDPVTCDGILYALPIGIHRVNRIYFNAELLELADSRLGQSRDSESILASLSSAEAFVEYLEQLGGLELYNGKSQAVAPLSAGHSPNWPIGTVLFDNLMAAIPGLYEAVWQGRVPSQFKLDAELRRWFRLALRSLAQTDINRAPTWRDALRQVESGEAIFTVIGDWASAELDSSTAHVREATFPPTASRFIYTPDSIAVPRTRDEDGGAPARYFLTELVDQKSVMLEFSKTKSSIPPRSDLTETDIQSLGSKLGKKYLEFRDCVSDKGSCEPLLAVSGYGPPPFTVPCFDEIIPLLLSAHALETKSEPPESSGAGGEGPAPPAAGDPSEQECNVEYPTSLEEIENEVVRRLRAVSANPAYQKYCPSGP